MQAGRAQKVYGLAAPANAATAAQAFSPPNTTSKRLPNKKGGVSASVDARRGMC